MSPLLEVIDKKEQKKYKPPKAPKKLKANIRDSLLENIENMSLNKLRSRQPKDLEKKSITIQHSPKISNLEMKKDVMKRKSSFVNIKRELNTINLNFVKNRKSKKLKGKNILHKTQSQQTLRTLYGSVGQPAPDDSLSEFNNVTKDSKKKSLIESFNKDKPEIEFIVSQLLIYTL